MTGLRDPMGRRIKLSDLRVLVAVAKAGSMGHAAKALHSSQPVVSRTVTELERMLAVRLFDRTQRGVEPTEHGQSLIKTAASMLDELALGLQKIEAISDPTRGEVRIGGTAPLARSIIAEAIERLSRRHTKIDFGVVIGESAELCRALVDRSLDVVVCRMLGSEQAEHLDAKTLFNDTFLVVTGPNNRWLKQPSVRLSDIVDERWMLPPADTLIGSLIADAFRSAGLEMPRAAITTNSVDVRERLLASGRFVTIVPSFMNHLPSRKTKFKVLPIELPIPRRPIAIVTLKGRTLSPVTRLLIDQLHIMAGLLSAPSGGLSNSAHPLLSH